jgi:hypothetical protein
MSRLQEARLYERRLTHDCIAALLPMCVEEQQQIGRYPQERLEIDVFLPRSAWTSFRRCTRCCRTCGRRRDGPGLCGAEEEELEISL